MMDDEFDDFDDFNLRKRDPAKPYTSCSMCRKSEYQGKVLFCKLHQFITDKENLCDDWRYCA